MNPLINLPIVIKVALSIVLGLLVVSTELSGQRDEWVRPGEKEQVVVQQPPQHNERPNDFVSNLWYGGGVALGFASSNRQSDFVIGLFPVIGYHLSPQVSFGLRTGVAYNYTKFETSVSQDEEFSLFDYSFGPLIRYKAFGSIFLHGEIELESNNYVVFDTRQSDYIKDREFNTNTYLGLGFSAGGGFEMMILYNFSDNPNSINSDFIYRVGYIYNF